MGVEPFFSFKDITVVISITNKDKCVCMCVCWRYTEQAVKTRSLDTRMCEIRGFFTNFTCLKRSQIMPFLITFSAKTSERVLAQECILYFKELELIFPVI